MWPSKGTIRKLLIIKVTDYRASGFNLTRNSLPKWMLWKMNVVKTECFIFFYLKDVSDNLDFFCKLGFQFESLIVKLDLFCHRTPFLKDLVNLDFHIAEDTHVTVALCADSICEAWRRSKPARFQVMASIPGLHNFQYFEGIRNYHFSPKCSLMR